MVNELLKLGFVEAGSWSLQSDKPSVTLNQHDCIFPSLYAFVDDGDVVYIGKSTNTLKKRMYQYMKPGSRQETNIRNHASIISALSSNRKVRVFVFKCDAPIVYKGITINLAAALEDPLIALFKPPWNKTGKS